MLESEHKYKHLLEGLGEAAFRIKLPELSFEFFSKSAKAVYGYDREKFIENPNISRLLSDPRLMNAIGKGFEFRSQVIEHLSKKFRIVKEQFNLASKEDLVRMKDKLNNVEREIQKLSKQLHQMKSRHSKRTIKRSPATKSEDTSYKNSN